MRINNIIVFNNKMNFSSMMSNGNIKMLYLDRVFIVVYNVGFINNSIGDRYRDVRIIGNFFVELVFKNVIESFMEYVYVREVFGMIDLDVKIIM